MLLRTVISLILCCLIASSILFGGDTKKYGKSLTIGEPTPVAALRLNPDEYHGKKVLIEGTIAEVCQMKGCWITIIDNSSEEPIKVKVEDDVIVFPKEGKGWKVRAEGTVSVKTLTVEERVRQARHEAEEQGKLESFDPSAIKGPETMVRIEGTGAEIVHE